MAFKVLNLKFGMLRYLIRFSVERLPDARAVGIFNITEDGYFLPFFDYDEVFEKESLMRDIYFIQKNYDVGTLLILKSSVDINKSGQERARYHVIGFTKFTFKEYREMLENVRCDEQFKDGYKFNEFRAWVLRIGEKRYLHSNKIKPIPFPIEVVPSKTSKEANHGMLMFIKKYHDIDLSGYFRKIDKTKNVYITCYHTSV